MAGSRRFRRLVVDLLLCAIGVVAAGTPPASGQSLPLRPGLVVVGRVADAQARWDATHTLYTYVTIDVARVVVGDAVPSRLVLKQLGGEVDGIGLWIADQATFQIAETVLLDLATAADGSLRTTGLARGKWTIEVDAGVVYAAQRHSERLPLAAIEAQLATVRRPSAAFAAEPPESRAQPFLNTPQFSYLPTGGLPARWHEVDTDTAVFVDFAGIPGTWSGATSDENAAIALWRASGMELDLRRGGAWNGGCPVPFTGNGRISVAYNDPCGTVADWVVGGGYFTTGDKRTVNGQEFQKFVQGFVILDNAGPQTSDADCFQNAVAHGLGHALGLGHSTSGAVMNAGPPATCAAGPIGLSSDDIAGITTIYEGIASGVAPPGPPSGMTATASLSTVGMSWTPAATGGAADRFLIDAGTAPGTYNIGTLVVTAPATSFAVGNVPTGTYYVRVRAQNALGTSGPSNEASVTVGACTPPGAPATFTATSNDQVVSLAWSPPPIGVVQGYQVVAGTASGLSNLAVLPLPGTTTALGGPVPYGQYFTRVHATNVCGVGPPSAEVLLNVQPCTAAPSAPTGLAGNVVGRMVGLGWAAPAAGPLPTGYTLQVGSNTGLSNILVYPTGTTATSLGAPAPPGTYYVRVAATNACGASAPSNEVVLIVP